MMRNFEKPAEVPDLSLDSVSCIRFSPTSNHLAVTSWDGSIRFYEVNSNTAASVAKVKFEYPLPLLQCRWTADGTKIATSGVDRMARLYDVNSNQSIDIGMHESGIQGLEWVAPNILATGSWDKTIKYWDLRSPQPAGVVNMPERVYAMGFGGGYLVAATADRNLTTINVNQPTTIIKQNISTTNYQIRDVAVYPSGRGFAVATIEGRVVMHYFPPFPNNGEHFGFKCHREGNKVFPVNTVGFHPTYHTLVSGGGDGQCFIWDPDSRQRVKSWPVSSHGPIVSHAFNADGSLFAYACSYDWHRGQTPAISKKPAILIYKPKDEDVKPKNKN